jgi:hypothetical protein
VPGFAEIFDAESLDHKSKTHTLNDTAQSVGWIVLQPGESICLEEDTSSIVISGVTWSKPDLDVLDELAARETAGTRVWFFNPDYVFPDDRILPGVPRMVTTPVLAEYSGKRLGAFVQGGSISGGVIDRIRNLFPQSVADNPGA